MNKQEILKCFNKNWDIASKKYNMPFFKFVNAPAVTFFERGTICGKAWRDGSKVAFNTVIAGVAKDAFENTIIHEIAHIVQYRMYPKSKPHGTEWKNIFMALGGNGQRCSSYDLTESTIYANRHEALCLCSKHMLTTQRVNKMKKGVTYSCTKCKTVLKLVPVK